MEGLNSFYHSSLSASVLPAVHACRARRCWGLVSRALTSHFVLATRVPSPARCCPLRPQQHTLFNRKPATARAPIVPHPVPTTPLPTVQVPATAPKPTKCFLCAALKMDGGQWTRFQVVCKMSLVSDSQSRATRPAAQPRHQE